MCSINGMCCLRIMERMAEPDAASVPLSVERVSDPGGDQIHVIVGNARTVFSSDHFLEILRKLQWAVAIDRALVKP